MGLSGLGLQRRRVRARSFLFDHFGRVPSGLPAEMVEHLVYTPNIASERDLVSLVKSKQKLVILTAPTVPFGWNRQPLPPGGTVADCARRGALVCGRGSPLCRSFMTFPRSACFSILGSPLYKLDEWANHRSIYCTNFLYILVTGIGKLSFWRPVVKIERCWMSFSFLLCSGTRPTGQFSRKRRRDKSYTSLDSMQKLA